MDELRQRKIMELVDKVQSLVPPHRDALRRKKDEVDSIPSKPGTMRLRQVSPPRSSLLKVMEDLDHAVVNPARLGDAMTNMRKAMLQSEVPGMKECLDDLKDLLKDSYFA